MIFTMLIGYARVSMQDQNPDLQTDALKQAGCRKIFVDKMTGAASNRPELNNALSHLRQGDVLTVWRLDRLGRSLKHLIEIVGKLEKKKIGFKSLQESIDTTTTPGRLIFHIFGALAEFERNLIKERTCAGIAAARARGKRGGRPKALGPKKKELALKLYGDGVHSVADICSIMRICKQTLYNYINELKA